MTERNDATNPVCVGVSRGKTHAIHFSIFLRDARLRALIPLRRQT